MREPSSEPTERMRWVGDVAMQVVPLGEEEAEEEEGEEERGSEKRPSSRLIL